MYQIEKLFIFRGIVLDMRRKSATFADERKDIHLLDAEYYKI